MKNPMNDIGALVDTNGVVLRIRPFPGGPARESPLVLNDGSRFLRLTEAQIGTVQVGWITVNDGESYTSP